MDRDERVAPALQPGQVHRVVGYADSEPLVPEDPFADANRRLSILAERRGGVGRAAEPPTAATVDAPATPAG